jgi:pyridoxal phosphate enzyme (YggS family)
MDERSPAAERLAPVTSRIAAACARAGRDPAGVTIVAVSKSFGPQAVLELYRAGQRHFGENRVQEAALKIPEVARAGATPVWHFVGHLQTNKVAAALRLFAILHSVDSLKLAEAISRRATRPVDILLEVNVAHEPAKYGFDPAEVDAAVRAVSRLPNLNLRGLMTVAPLVENPEEVRPLFRRLRELRDAQGLAELSMGMTNDFEVAVEEGATLVRIGRALFGEREGR